MTTPKMGQHGRDIVSGYEGLVMSRSEHLTGCTQLLLVPRALDKDGNRKLGEWFDEQRVERVGDIEVVLDNGKTPGNDEGTNPRR